MTDAYAKRAAEGFWKGKGAAKKRAADVKLDTDRKYAAYLHSYKVIEASKASFAIGQPEWELCFSIVEREAFGKRLWCSIFPFDDGVNGGPNGMEKLSAALSILGVGLEEDQVSEANIKSALAVAERNRAGVWVKPTKRFPNKCYIEGWRDNSRDQEHKTPTKAEVEEVELKLRQRQAEVNNQKRQAAEGGLGGVPF